MLSTGDVQGCLRKLQTLLRAIKYPGDVDYNGLSKGDPSAFLPIVSFTLTSFSPPLAEQLMSTGHELVGKTDLRFTDTLYKVLRDVFHYKPILTKQQFLQWGFSQRKISVLCDIISMVLQKHKQLKKPRVRHPSPQKDGTGRAHLMLTYYADTVPNRAFVVNHIENPSTFSPISPHEEAFSSTSPGDEITEMAGGDEDTDNTHSSAVEERLSSLEAQLHSVVSGLDRLCVLDKRLEQLERWRETDKMKGDVITISRETWENVMSRVLLLETKLELRDTQEVNIQPTCQPSASAHPSSSMLDDSKEELTNRLQRITDMLKSTSSLLKDTESSSTPGK